MRRGLQVPILKQQVRARGVIGDVTALDLEEGLAYLARSGTAREQEVRTHR